VTLAGTIFGVGSHAYGFTVPSCSAAVTSLGLFVLAFVLGTHLFALGVLIVSPGSTAAKRDDLIRPDPVPLIFISGIFVPLADMQGLALTLAYFSPLTYLVDLFNAAMQGISVFSPAVDCGVLIGIFAGFLLAARFIQKRNLMKGM
jgi:ABC-2 type transport system permease protein